MAFMDHTAHARLLVRNEPNSKPIPTIGNALDAAGEERERQRTCKSHLAGAALSIAVMDGLLKSHHASKHAHTEDKRAGLLSLNAAQRIGLLHHGVDTLTPGRGG